MSEGRSRTQRMLDLIDQRLATYSVEETVERLHSYGGVGPTVDEFLSIAPTSPSLNSGEWHSDLEDPQLALAA